MVVSAIQAAALDQIGTLFLGNGANLAQREQDFGALHHGGRALHVQEGNQRLAGPQFQQRVVGLEGRIGAERIRRHFHGLLVLGRIRTQGMLHAVAQLAQDIGRNVRRALRNEPDAHALGTDEANHLLDLVRKGLRRALEQHVGLVKEEHQLGQVHFPHLRQRGIQFREQPQQEGGVKLGLEHEFVRRQHIHDALSALALQEVVNVKIRLAKELVGALVFQFQQCTLDSTHRGLGHIAILGGELRGVLPHKVEHGTQVLQVDEQ